MSNKLYAAIDLKSFYASVECVLRGLDPLKTNLVVADESRSINTICLAVSPALRSYNISGRLRLFELIARVNSINVSRKLKAKNRIFTAKSYDKTELDNDYSLELTYIIAKPRMATYIKYSSEINNIYLKYIDKKDIHIYSIDEVFIDLSPYIKLYKLNAYGLVKKIILDVLHSTKISASAGIGSNLYLAKVAMDILAKKQKDNNIAILDEENYKKLLWNYSPISDFWRVGKACALKLEKLGIKTMGDLARFSLKNEEKLYEIFGINAELLIDHAWAYEPCTMQDIKNYKSKNNSKTMAKVLYEPFSFSRARLVLKEMLDMLVLELVEKDLKTKQIVLDIKYDKESLNNKYTNVTKFNIQKKEILKNAHSSINLYKHTSSFHIIMNKTLELFDLIVDSRLFIRQINLTFNNVKDSKMIYNDSLFDVLDDKDNIKQQKEEKIQKLRLELNNKFGKNTIIKASNLDEELQYLNINSQLGGHNA